MHKLIVSIKKEFWQLVADKVGLALMFVMPVLLVVVITVVQDSAYRVVNENVISMIVLNDDEGETGDELVSSLGESGLFDITKLESKDANVISEMNENDALVALSIPSDFSEIMWTNAAAVSNKMMTELDATDTVLERSDVLPNLELHYDPVLQEQYRTSVVNVLTSHIEMLQSKMMIDAIFMDIGYESTPKELQDEMLSEKATIDQIPATEGEGSHPNSTQHNVPAWTIFAMFFMVVSLGGNLVKERLNGSFLRIRSMPSSLTTLLAAKVILFTTVGFMQVVVIFTVAGLTFPSLGLPELQTPSNLLGFVLTIITASLAAVSFAMLIGSYAKTQVQANGVGAVLIVIFAALGGIWVPTFVMPEYLQTVSLFSPLNWCLEGFYTLFLRGGNWNELLVSLGFIFIFTLACQALILLKLKIEKLI